jgi:PTS system mannose-specific IIA component
MVGIVVAAHGRLAEELVRTAEGVVGPLAQTTTFSIQSGSTEDGPGQLRRAIAAVDQGEGVVMLTDLLGGSPTNLCLGVLKEREVEVVTGVNLPMLLKLGSLRAAHTPPIELARQLCAAGQKAIVEATDLVRGRKP